MNSAILHLLRLVPAAGLALALACGSAATPLPATPTAGPESPGASSPTFTPEREVASTPTPRPARTPTLTPGDVGPISEEQLDEELKRARFSTRGWSTNFRLRSINYGEILSGGLGKDDIPAIDNPRFEPVAEADHWLEDQEPVQVVNINGDARAYPLQIMIWHEIVNDVVGDEPVIITY